MNAPAAGGPPACEPQTLAQALRSHGGDALRVVLVNTAIGLAVSVIMDMSLGASQIYSHAIGWSIFALAVVLSRWLRATRADARALLVAVPAGSVAGMLLASRIVGDGLFDRLRALELRSLGVLVLPLAIGMGMAYYFYSRGLLAEREAQLREAELNQAVERQRAGEAQLKLLQAQIEPHFLFNTLSNVVGLIDERPQAAKTMLVDLTRLLRRSLLRARADALPLGEEIADLRAYLDIQAQRLGPRLRYAIEVAPALEAWLVAPYLLQPLVENALQHGLEPLIEGGTVDIRVARDGEQLCIEVADTGRGLCEDHPPGVALANIRARLAALYGGRARLSLHPNQPRGVVARLSLPLSHPAMGGAAARP
jgi:sensor histidine kinase YesM